MQAERWQEIEMLFHSVLGVAPEERAAFLRQACRGDEALRLEVERLMANDSEAKAFMESRALDVAARALAKNQPGSADLTGQTVRHYRIMEKIGAGGMGEVYRANDSHLKRDVAIKVMTDIFSGDPERLARFDREAKLLASLNHPNIAAIYGLEKTDSGPLLVMELVEGETLAHRIAKGPLPVDEALEVCRQIAEGLEAAHEKGIVHRDLKPANVKITPEGKVKVLDFGLAKAFQGEIAAADASHSPTLTDQMTRPGVILGTTAYMSPEQTRGKAVDKRTDIWAFGCVLYECLAGKRSFEGETVTETLASILKGEPDWQALPSDGASKVREVLERCLKKDPRQRLHDIADARLELDDSLTTPSSMGAPALQGTALSSRRPVWGLVLPWMLTGILVLTLLDMLLMRTGQPALYRPGSTPKFDVSLSGNNSLDFDGDIAISPDGLLIAFVATSAEGNRLYLRKIDEWESRAIPGTDGASFPFFSPDSRWLAFTRGRAIEKIPVQGGTPQVVCATSNQNHFGNWGKDGAIVFAAWPEVGLWRVSSDGGTPEILTRWTGSNGMYYVSPEFLPGEGAFLFTMQRQGETSIAVFARGMKEPRTVIRSGNHPHFLPTGHLLYVLAGRLMAVLFDINRFEAHGAAIVVADGLSEQMLNVYAVSNSGTLIYVPSSTGLSRLVWRDRLGALTPLQLDPRHYTAVVLSSDGRRLAVSVRQGTKINIWAGSVDQEPLTRLTFGNNDFTPVWSNDGRMISFISGQADRYNLYRVRSDGSGKAERLTDSPNAQKPSSSSPNDDILLFNEVEDKAGLSDISQLELATGQVRPFLKTDFVEAWGQFSPNGKWVAYMSNESGREEIYVRPYPGPNPKLQISAGGGTLPRWNRNGREIFYRNGMSIMSVPVLNLDPFRVGSPTRLFTDMFQGDFDVSPDGQRFLLLEKAETGRGAARINLVQNWFEELKRLVPTGKK